MPQIGEYFRQQKTGRYLENHRITVRPENYPTTASIILSTHPTVDETLLFRSIDPNALQIVHDEAVCHTHIRTIDEQWAVHISGIIPLYSGDHNLRNRSYRLVKEQLDKGRSVILHPTGRTEGTAELPDVTQIHIGGLVRILQDTQHKYPVVPARIHVNDNNIIDGQKLRDGSLVQIRFGQPYGITLPNRKLTPEEVLELQKIIWSSWSQL